MAKYVPLSEAELNNESSIFSSVAPPNTPAANLIVQTGILSFNYWAVFIPSWIDLALAFT